MTFGSTEMVLRNQNGELRIPRETSTGMWRLRAMRNQEAMAVEEKMVSYDINDAHKLYGHLHTTML